MRHIFILLYAQCNEWFRSLLMLSQPTMKLLFMPGFSMFRSFNGIARAYAEFDKAKRTVPAYRKFLATHNFSNPSFTGITPNLHEIPSTDKQNYVKQYGLDERCTFGEIPTEGVVIDESSGSSGTATNWVRGAEERKLNARFIRFGIQNAFGTKPLFVINAFALGAWATGVNVTMSCVPFSRLKSLGCDRVKIENTLKHFGNTHHYVIMGYPPFLKSLVDTASIHWHDYHVSFILGGESMSEGMRDYFISKGIKKIISSLGASDLELNLAAENDFTISLRNLVRSNPQLQKKLLKHTGALPMVFQFNPADFLFETSATGELIVTVCRPGYVAPKIRYNIHDKGHVLELKELYRLLKELKINPKSLVAPQTDLPLLFHYGRADMTVSFFGSNISPTDIQESIYNMEELSSRVNSFCMATQEDGQGNKQLIVSMELQKDKDLSGLDEQTVCTDFFEQLAKTNQDFREAKKMLSLDDQTIIRFYDFGEGPFENNDIRIKARYIDDQPVLAEA